MKKILVSIIALSLLTGCAKLKEDWESVKSNVSSIVTPDNFDSVTIAMGTAESAGFSYRDLCERKIINKKCWAMIAMLQPYENKAYISYTTLKKFVKANPTADASTFIREARDAITSLRNMQTQNGVN